MDELDTNLSVRDELPSPRVSRTSFEAAMMSKDLREAISYTFPWVILTMCIEDE